MDITLLLLDLYIFPAIINCTITSFLLINDKTFQKIIKDLQLPYFAPYAGSFIPVINIISVLLFFVSFCKSGFNINRLKKKL